jgi:hypothetical protein
MGGMEAVPDMSLHKVALIVLGAAGVVISLFHLLQVSPVIGFMVVGMAVGPFGFGSLTAHYAWLTAVTIDAPHAIQPVAPVLITTATRLGSAVARPYQHMPIRRGAVGLDDRSHFLSAPEFSPPHRRPALFYSEIQSCTSCSVSVSCCA